MTSVKPQPHHVRAKESHNRPLYRRGRRCTAVKVFTIVDESQHLLIFGVPVLELKDELTNRCNVFGEVEVYKVEDYPNLEEFTDLYHLCFKKIASARAAKKKLDGLEFFGGVLHVCYAPELETVDETRSKIIQRSKMVYSKLQVKRKKIVGFLEINDTSDTTSKS